MTFEHEPDDVRDLSAAFTKLFNEHFPRTVAPASDASERPASVVFPVPPVPATDAGCSDLTTQAVPQ